MQKHQPMVAPIQERVRTSLTAGCREANAMNSRCSFPTGHGHQCEHSKQTNHCSTEINLEKLICLHKTFLLHGFYGHW